MKKIIVLLLLPFWAIGQNTIGFPDVTNYAKYAYNGGLQNWDIKQDKNDIIYFANNEGLLTFDGTFWNLFPLPNKTIVRSVDIGNDGKIYVGGQDELGYFSPTNNGLLEYHSLTKFIQNKDKSFGDVWDIVVVKNVVFFRSANKIFKFINESVEVYNAISEWTYLTICNGKLYAHDYKTGILSFENNNWNPLLIKNDLPQNDPVTSILPLNNNILVSTLKNGLYNLSQTGYTKLKTTNNTIFQNQRIYAATQVNKDWIALATNSGGIYIIDTIGNIIQSFSITEGLQNNNVLSIFLDKQSNLWLGLDNGIDLIAYNSAIKKVNPLLQDGSGYASIVYNSNLYMGTSNGLYSIPLQKNKDLSFSKGNFSLINNTKGQVWGLSVINNQLLLGHHEGAFTITNNTAVPINTDKGTWNFEPMSNTFPTPSIITGNYKGLTYFNYIDNKFIKSENIPDFDESSRFVAIDQYNNIWVSHPYHGVYKISKYNNATSTKTIYTNNKGLPSNLNNHIYKIRNEVVVATENGVYSYNYQKDFFEPSEFYKKILGNQSIRYLKEDLNGNIWFVHDKLLGVIDFSASNPNVIYFQELNKKILSGFEFIYPIDSNNIFLGGEKGFFHLNYEKYKKNLPTLKVQIRKVSLTDQKDSLLFGGYIDDNIKRVIPKVSYGWKVIRFEFSSSLFGCQSNLEYSYRLKGFDDNWSEWTKRTEKEYTNLVEGNYTFEVKVRNNLGNESAVAEYTVEILPPWYKSNWAIVLFLLIISSCILIFHLYQKKKFERRLQKQEEEQNKQLYIVGLEKSKAETEVVTLQNEKLEAEIDFKNSELASSAMHLVKKGELLTKIKSELSQIMRSYDNPQATGEIKKLLKSLGEDDNIDKEWEAFSKHFDKVHNNFLTALKEKHPDITPTELKLSAYLNMNLSTKEIAQLMNISVRGVEISRYRLRKKLQLSTETNLVDYMLSIEKKG
ncbi:MAG: triple tyrosine motif-containing protein [Bacteroidetes bacterium]|nr:triple tyrosine motif-containing protein [Bacteroidota bacterium]